MLPDFGGIEGGVEFALPFAIVAEVCGFEHARDPDFLGGLGEFFWIVYDGKGGAGKAVGEEKGFFSFAVLRDMEDFGIRKNPAKRRSGFFEGSGTNIFKFKGQDIRGFCQRCDSREIRVIGGDRKVSDLRRGTIFFGVEDADAIPEFFCFDGKHPTQLAASENADGATGKKGFTF